MCSVSMQPLLLHINSSGIQFRLGRSESPGQFSGKRIHDQQAGKKAIALTRLLYCLYIYDIYVLQTRRYWPRFQAVG